MSLALRIENGEIDGWRQRHRLDLLAGRAAIGLHRVLVSSPIRAGTAPASRSGVWLLARSVSTGTCAPAGGTPLAALFLLEKCSAAPAGGKLLTALFLLGKCSRVCILLHAHARARRDRAAAIFLFSIAAVAAS